MKRVNLLDDKEKSLVNLLNVLNEADKDLYNLVSSFIVVATGNEDIYKNHEYELSDLQEITKNLTEKELYKFNDLFFSYLLSSKKMPNYITNEKLSSDRILLLAEFYEGFVLIFENKNVEERLEKVYEKEFYKVDENTFIESFHLLSFMIYRRLIYENSSLDVSKTYENQLEHMFKNGLALLDKKAKDNPEIKDKIYNEIANEIHYKPYLEAVKIIDNIMKEREDFKKYYPS